jgi:hypothetical protein
VKFGPGLSKQIRQGEAFGESLIERFLPDIETLGTVDADRSEEVQNLINQQSAFADQAGTRSDEATQAVELAQQGLGGLTAAENDALRAQGFQGLDRSFQAGQRALARAQGRSGVRGAAGAAQARDLIRDRGDAVRGLERDILLENIGIQDARRNAFANLIAQQEGREFAQQQAALQGLQGLTQSARQDELARQQFNLGQQANLLSGQQALFFGGQGLIDARRNAIQNARLARQQQQAAIDNANAQAQAAQQAAMAQQALIAQNALPQLF